MLGDARYRDLQNQRRLPPHLHRERMQPLFFQGDTIRAGGRHCIHAGQPERPPEGDL